MPFSRSGRATQTFSAAALSGLLEAGAAAGCVAVMFTLFLAGHADALRKACGPDGSPRRRTAHTLRLPLQAPLIAWAWSLRAPGRPAEGILA
jgi:uncharacterized membrane protein